MGAPGTARPNSAISIHTGGKDFVAEARSDGSLCYELPEGIVPPVEIGFTLPTGEPRSLIAAVFDAESHLQRDCFTTGQAPNDMMLAQGRFYIANAMDNNVSILDADSLEPRGTLALPEYASPSYLFVRGDIGFVTCNGNNILVAFSPNDGGELWTLQLPAEGVAFLGPGKPYASDSFVFIPLANIESFGNPSAYRRAEVVVVDITTHEIEKRIALAGEDALEVTPLYSGQLVVVEAGNISFDENWRPYTTTPSHLEVIDELTLEVVRTVDLGVIGAANPLVDATLQRVYLASLLDGNLYTVSTGNWTVERGETDPVVVGAETSFLSDLILIDHTVVAASFNEDRVYAVSAEDYSTAAWPLPEPLEVGTAGGEGFLAGPQTLVWDGAAHALYFLQGLANRVGRFEAPH